MKAADVTVLAPAKLNLGLHITGRRGDGYHTLQTVFQLIDRCDELTVSLTGLPPGTLCLRCDDPWVPLDGNLILRAADALRQAVNRPDLSADITLTKRIPLGAGLGGGSSDAALTLRTLNQLWQLGLDIADLAAIGVGLGADVPVFVHGRSAFAGGIGEALVPVELPPRWYLVVWPGITVNTGSVFQDPELTRDTPVWTMRDFLAGGWHNDCEPVVRKRHPEVAWTLDRLAAFGSARLTGTGAAVYVGFDDRASAQAAHQALGAMDLPAGSRYFVAQGLNRLP